ncbi:MAG: DUF6364 family protein [Burkholderiales bacterium]
MKTTLDIDDRLLAEAKSLAAREQTSLTKLIEEGLSLRLRPQQARAGSARINLPVSGTRGGGLYPHIDYTSNRSMFQAVDEEEGS